MQIGEMAIIFSAPGHWTRSPRRLKDGYKWIE
jgi:hypothetical protein